MQAVQQEQRCSNPVVLGPETLPVRERLPAD